MRNTLFDKLRQQEEHLQYSREVAVDLFHINNRPLICQETVEFNVLVDDERPREPFQQEFIVVQGIMEDCVLGLDDLYQHNFMIDGRERHVYRVRESDQLLNLDQPIMMVANSRLPPGLRVNPYVSTKPNRFFQIALINETNRTIVLPRYTTLGHVSFKPRTPVASCSNRPSNLQPDVLEASLPDFAEDVKSSLRNLVLANQHVFTFKISDLGNTVMKKDSFPFPRIDDVLDLLHGQQRFSTQDLASGNWQIEIEEPSKEKLHSSWRTTCTSGITSHSA
ncbi:hypothetical protein OUZ56_025518 [Daphnia magna]|uniref:Uncharacterized protein n=1 Tax=Daphnia magna TaxID=35525 RepID=A0ABQ9ZLH2_9CRUS|nr:hypothetical protein OUZ56_025518 [Daphnia magna]